MRFTPALRFSSVLLLMTQMAAGQYLRGVNVSGAEFGEQNIPGTYGHDYTYNSAETFDYFAARNLKFIRLQIRWERLQPKLQGPLDPFNLSLLQQDVAWAKAAGCLISIDAHNYGRYKTNEAGQPSDGFIIDNAYGGVVKVSTADLTDFWVRMSNAFKNEPAVAAYDIMNEPHDMGSADWLKISQAVLTGIRANGDNKLVMIPGNSYSSATFWPQVNGSSGWINDPANNYLYEAHLYFDHDYSGSYDRSYDAELAANPQLPTVGVTRLMPFVNWCKANNAPCYLGEYGIPNDDARWNTVLDNFLKALDAAAMPGTYWAAGEWWGNYRLSVQPINFAIDRPQTPVLLGHLSPGAFTSISAAAAYGYATAPGQLVSGYGANLAPGTEAAASLPLMTALQGTQVQITDSAGQVSLAPMILASPGQLNYLLPASVANGKADVAVISSGNTVANGVLEVRSVAPTIFTADNSGQGTAAAQIVRIKPDGTQSYEYVAAYDTNQSKYVPLPIRFGGDTLVLLLYGTGFDMASGAAGTTVTIGTRSPAVQYSGPQKQFPGLDQINLALPSSLAGTGTVTVNVTVDGKAANSVTLNFQ